MKLTIHYTPECASPAISLNDQVIEGRVEEVEFLPAIAGGRPQMRVSVSLLVDAIEVEQPEPDRPAGDIPYTWTFHPAGVLSSVQPY